MADQYANSERPDKTRDRYNIKGMLIALGIVFIVLLIGIPAALSGNLLFFVPTAIEQEPVMVHVYHNGQQISFEPGDAEYRLLVDAVYEAISTENGFLSMGWSNRRFSQARNDGVAVELIYDEPVVLPGNRINSGHPIRLFVPLDVYGTNNPPIVFRGGAGQYWGDPMRVVSLEPVATAVNVVVGDSTLAE
ncbi:MAG: hypothetical protein GYB68_04410 [Chloroflexi bacterium]|nr:hypothetical protein [Chloroflexota bacterium]